MSKIKGNGVSSGIAIAHLAHFKAASLKTHQQYGNGAEVEKNRLDDALKIADNELDNLTKQAALKIGEEHALIFSAQQMMLKDPDMLSNAYVKINDFNLDAAYAFKQTMSEMIDLFELSDNQYIKERILDIHDVTDRVINILTGKEHKTYHFDRDIILVANDLLPSETMHLDPAHIKGLIIEKGSKTSHSAILARNLGIPAITGVTVSKLDEGLLVIMDGSSGNIILNPSDEDIKVYQKLIDEKLVKQRKYLDIKDKVAQTKDGRILELAANVGVLQDVEDAISVGAKGIGLLRTENQYLESSDFPTEDDLLAFYQTTAHKFKDDNVVIRTLDIGGDKNLSYLNLRKELNPFLGNRAIRYSLSYPSLLKTQLRAILRANSSNNIHLMFPMISTLEELMSSIQILDETILELAKEGQVVNRPKVGMMVEVPLVAVGIEKFLDHVDFISIGTNDLIQYMFAADRMNERVAHLYQPYHPVLLSTIKSVIDKATKRGIIVSVCGEMAGHKAQSLLLIGLGLTNLSMHANLILENKYLISKTNYEDLKKLADDALNLSYNDEVEALINNYIKGLNI